MKFLIDVAVPAVCDDGTSGTKMFTYEIEAETAKEAVDNFMAVEADYIIVYEGEAVHHILLGIERIA